VDIYKNVIFALRVIFEKTFFHNDSEPFHLYTGMQIAKDPIRRGEAVAPLFGYEDCAGIYV
jgi:hypothetical protein